MFSYAQETNSHILKRAEQEFDEGKIEDLPKILKDSVIQNLTSKYKIQAYRLLIQVYIFENNKAKVDELMLKLLNFEPEYELQQDDEADFQYAFNSFTSLPVYSVSAYAGYNHSIIYTTELYGLNNLSSKEFSYTNEPSFHFGISFNKMIKEAFEVNLSLVLSNNNFTYKEKNFDFSEINFFEKQSRIVFPVNFTYNITKTKLKPYISTGLAISYLAKSTAIATRDYLDASHTNIVSSEIPMRELRNNLSLFVSATLGLKYKIKHAYIFFNIKHDFSITKTVNNNNRYLNQDIMYKYYYTDNDYMLNNLSFSIGYTYLFYNPRKINKEEE